MKRLLSLLFFLILFFPMGQMFFGFIPKQSLNGAEENVELLKPNIKSWLAGDLQKNFQDWFATKIGFRGYFIKIDNQINFSLFREISGSKNAEIILGKNGYLYERGYIDNLIKQHTDSLVLSENVIKIKKMQQELNERGVTFLFIISPSKATMYPEYIPNRFLDKGGFAVKTDYENILPLLKSEEINYVDGHKILFTKKIKDSGIPVFTKSGTHWSYYGACLVSEDIVDKLEVSLNRVLTKIECDPPRVVEEPYGIDIDLLNLLNVWFSGSSKSFSLEPIYEIEESSDKFKPNILYVGGSFIWNLTQIMEEKAGIFESRNFFYYYSTDYSYPDYNEVKIAKENFDWDKEVLSRDVVILEANETNLSNPGFGFVEDFLNFLDVDK